MTSDELFELLLPFIFGNEGGYVNNPNDIGGKTNFGITQNIFNEWRKKQGLPQGDVKTDISKSEAKKIYYNWYWKESGADKLNDPRDAYTLFDFAVNTNPYYAKNKFKESNYNFYTMLENRKKHYENQAKQPNLAQFKEVWFNRLKDVENNANKIINEGLWRPDYYNEITPFDKGYNGSLNQVDENIPDRQNKRNKYQYLRNKAIQDGIIKSDNKDSLAFPRKWEDLTPWEKEEMLRRYI